MQTPGVVNVPPAAALGWGVPARSSCGPQRVPVISPHSQALSSDSREDQEVLVYDKEAEPQVMLHRGSCTWPREWRQCTFVFNFAYVGHSSLN